MTESTGQISLHQLRRDNVQLLLLQFTEAHLAQGHQAKGVEGLFAEHIGISRVSLSHIKTNFRNITDKIARQVEVRAGKAVGWLDSPQTVHTPTSAETHFLELAQAAWRSTNAAGRRQLLKMARSGFLPPEA